MCHTAILASTEDVVAALPQSASRPLVSPSGIPATSVDRPAATARPSSLPKSKVTAVLAVTRLAGVVSQRVSPTDVSGPLVTAFRPANDDLADVIPVRPFASCHVYSSFLGF